MNRSRELAIGLLLAFVSLIAFWMGVEAALRLLDIGRSRPAIVSYVFPNGQDIMLHPMAPIGGPVGGKADESSFYDYYRYKPYASYASQYPDNPRGYFEAGNRMTYTMNGHGFRDREFIRGKGGKFRIAAVGDSISLGEGVKPEDVYPRVLEMILRPDCPSCEALNFGVNGYEARDEIQLLKDTVMPFRPDIVVWEYFINDIVSYEANARLVEKLFALREHLDPFMRTPSRLVNFVFRRVWLAFQSRETEKTLREAYDSPAEIESFAGIMRETKASVTGSGARLLVVIFPDLRAYRGREYLLARMHEKVAAVLRRESIPFIDLTGKFGDSGPRSLWVHETDHHPNDTAHRLAAEEIAAAFKRLGFLPGA